MENSAQALQMAAGIIIALLLLSLFVYVFGIINNSENTKVDKEIAEENAEFNKKFLAFEKSSMYGTDLISILGLAISNNETQKQRYEAHPDGSFDENVDGAINIEFGIIEPVTAITRVYNYERNWDPAQRKYIVEWIENLGQKTTTSILEGGKTYSLKGKKYSQREGEIFEKIRKIAVEGNSSIEVKTTGTVRRETDNSGFKELKKRIFQCTDINYNKTGKINYMRFEEKNTNTTP